MIEALQLRAVNALPETYLVGLGKLNVVCGRNNSGKSTLLRSIDDPKMRAVGRHLSDEDAHRMLAEYTTSTIYSENRSLRDALARIFIEVVRSKDIWYSGSTEFASGVGTRYGSDGNLRGYTFNLGRLTTLYEQAVGSPQLQCVLIPPRRGLEQHIIISLGQPVESGGRGLLNRLFFCQSQVERSRERTLTDRLLRSFEDISGGFSYRVIPDANNNINLHFRSPSGVVAEAEQCGQGLQDLLILLYFVISDQYDLLLIEEPESHLHPDMQRRLLAFMSQQDKQYVIATHSNVFLDSAYVDRVFQTSYDGEISVEDQTTRAALLSDLGYQVTDNLVSDAVVLVEGPSDIPVIETFLIKMGAFPKYQIKFWPLGGDIMDKVDLRVFSERYRLFALIDQDPHSDVVRKKFVKKCKEVGVSVCRLKRYAIENYLTVPAIRKVFNSQVPETVTALDPMIKVEKQLGFDIKSRTRNIAQHMEIRELDGTDLLKFLDQIVAACA